MTAGGGPTGSYVLDVLILVVLALACLALAFYESIEAQSWKNRAIVAERRLESVMSRDRLSPRVRVVRGSGVPEVFIRAFADDDECEDGGNGRCQ